MINILVVEDDIAINVLVCEYLKESGYATTSAKDGLQALVEMQQINFDLVISDIETHPKS